MDALQKVTFGCVVVAGITAIALPGLIHAQQNFPSKPIRIIVPFSPGGTSDILARLLSTKLSESWGQHIVIENRTGAGGTIGSGIVAKASPDGYTLLISSSAFVVSAALYTNLTYDPLKDFSGVTRLGFSTTALIVHPSLGIKSVSELVTLAQAKPSQLLYSHAGVGSGTFMNGERFRLAADIKVKPIGFKGASDAMLEVLAGRSHFSILSLASSVQFIKEGKLVALAVGMPQRSQLLPDVPTIAETLPGYKRDGSHSLLAPAATPRPILAQISNEVRRIFELPDIKERIKNFDFIPAPSTPEEHDPILRADIETFSGVVRLAGLRPQ